MACIVLRLDRSTSAHFIAQKSANSGSVSSRSTSLARRSGDGSTRNARASSGVGSRPTASRVARRTKSESPLSADGWIVMVRSLAKVNVSMKLALGGFDQTNPGRGSRYVSRTATIVSR